MTSRSEIYRLAVSDPDGVLVSRDGLSDADIAQIDALMSALADLRRAEAELAAASAKYMRLGPTDMRAVHFLIACQHAGQHVTAGAVASHLGISTASTTKLLDRLERAGHLMREANPDDRRSVVIRLAPETYLSAMDTVGRQQARRVHAAVALTPSQRDTVTEFLKAMTADLAAAELIAGAGGAEG